LGLEEVEGEAEAEEEGDGIDAVVGEVTEEMTGLTVSNTGAAAVEETGLGETGEEERGKGRVEEEATDGLADIGAVLGAATGDEIVETEGGI
jgi:hypothetical protein